ncbi:hypothetical protein AVEN_131476-1 [Araneus ventricosus]|uniref:Uncharacterized protein n=1 Tax=Araneus ventricosus TaxID=182803 RepID=A0A4Y2F244_ARAVE|nr:hypothetical protein AVEN_131476-1 [Araneus ventricosus]
MELSTVVKCIGNASLAAYASTTHSLSDDGQGGPTRDGGPPSLWRETPGEQSRIIERLQTPRTNSIGQCSCAPRFLFEISGDRKRPSPDSWWIGPCPPADHLIGFPLPPSPCFVLKGSGFYDLKATSVYFLKAVVFNARKVCFSVEMAFPPRSFPFIQEQSKLYPKAA